MKSISMSFRRSLTHIVHLLSLSSLLLLIRSFSHLLPLATAPHLHPSVILSHWTHPVHSILVAVHVSSFSPAELSACFSDASDHSQGLIMAVAIFSSKDNASFLGNIQKALKWLFFAGMRGQLLFPVLALKLSVIQ